MEWYESLTADKKREAIYNLFDIAYESELNICSEEEAKELADETGQSMEECLAPYYLTCGLPLVDCKSND